MTEGAGHNIYPNRMGAKVCSMDSLSLKTETRFDTSCKNGYQYRHSLKSSRMHV